jgi:hypothetical protein
MKTVWLWRTVLNVIDVNGIAKCTPTSSREPRKQSPRQNDEIEEGIRASPAEPGLTKLANSK